MSSFGHVFEAIFSFLQNAIKFFLINYINKLFPIAMKISKTDSIKLVSSSNIKFIFFDNSELISLQSL